MSRLEIPESETELRVFHNRLRILMNIDRYELVDAAVFDDEDSKSWPAFFENPHKWFIRCSDEQAASLWHIIKRREGGKP